MNGKIEALCISRVRGEKKVPVPRAILRKGWGIEGDAHAGDWHRQVSLLASESIDVMRAKLPTLSDGDFAENVVTRGIALDALEVGDRIALGESVVLEVTQIGKACHHGCAIREQVGDCIMPREGLFCRVVCGGELQAGDQVRPLGLEGEEPKLQPVSLSPSAAARETEVA